ncbi:hypothetical protein ABIA70_001415 [Arthrobacter sp. 754]
MLTYAFDLLFLMYEEAGYAPSDIPGLILKNNLFGAEIDPRAGALAAFALVMKARGMQKWFLNPGKGTEPNICVLEPVRFTADELDTLLTRGGDKHAEIAFWQAFEDADTFGSLIRPNQDLIGPLTAHVESLGEAETLFGGDVLDRARTVLRQSEYLSTRYHVVVANPPYMGSGNMGPKLAEFAKREYPDSRTDLFAMFIERSGEAALRAGSVAMITMQSWMFLTSYSRLRQRLWSRSTMLTMAHLGRGAFDSIGGDVVAATAFVLSNCHLAAHTGDYLRLVEGKSESEKAAVLRDASNRGAGEYLYRTSSDAFRRVPGAPVAYWLAEELLAAFERGRPLSTVADPKLGLYTGDDQRFMRGWSEVSFHGIAMNVDSRNSAAASSCTWFPCNKGGGGRRWYGNHDLVINWKNDGEELYGFQPRSGIRNPQFYFRESVSWSLVGTASPAFRFYPQGFIFTGKGPSIFSSSREVALDLLAFGNSAVADAMLGAMSPTMGFEVGQISLLPIVDLENGVSEKVEQLIQFAKEDWDSRESSWNFAAHPLLTEGMRASAIQQVLAGVVEKWNAATLRTHALEQAVRRRVGEAYGLREIETESYSMAGVTLHRNPQAEYGLEVGTEAADRMLAGDAIRDLVSYAVGCMFGRYSLDLPGLVLADQGDTLADYLAKVPSPSFLPDEDNVLPVLSDGWFEDDIVERFREFLKVSFGEQHFEENLRFVEEALGKDIRKYFVQDFYKDHVQRYKKRPIYWLFSSPKGSFNALIYMHRYRPDTVSVVLNDYLHEFQAKLRARRANLDQVAMSTLSTAKEQTAARKESEQIGKMLLELEEWEQSVLYPLATEQIAIDLDDGVKANYPKFGAALNNKFTGF